MMRLHNIKQSKTFTIVLVVTKIIKTYILPGAEKKELVMFEKKLSKGENNIYFNIPNDKGYYGTNISSQQVKFQCFMAINILVQCFISIDIIQFNSHLFV